MAVELDQEKKVEILRQILPQFWNEAIHWREDSWRFTTWLVSAYLLLAGISIYSDRGLLYAALVLLALSVGATFYLRKNYRNYCERMKLFTRVEEALLFFEDNIYIKDRSLLPKELQTKKIAWWRGQGIYIILWSVAFASWVSIYFQVRR
jgi:hypothetical protein